MLKALYTIFGTGVDWVVCRRRDLGLGIWRRYTTAVTT